MCRNHRFRELYHCQERFYFVLSPHKWHNTFSLHEYILYTCRSWYTDRPVSIQVYRLHHRDMLQRTVESTSHPYHIAWCSYDWAECGRVSARKDTRLSSLDRNWNVVPMRVPWQWISAPQGVKIETIAETTGEERWKVNWYRKTGEGEANYIAPKESVGNSSHLAVIPSIVETFRKVSFELFGSCSVLWIYSLLVLGIEYGPHSGDSLGRRKRATFGLV